MASDRPLPASEDLDGIIQRLEDRRRELDISRSEFSKRADKQRHCWQKILDRDSDPKVSTIKDFLGVVEEAEPDGPRLQPGRRASCLADGGGD